jgi:hypothetical protein
LYIVGKTVEPIRRTRSINTLMRSLVIIVVYPVVDTLTGIGKRREHRLTQILAPQCLPEPFDTLLLQHSLKTRLATPCHKLSRII